MQGIRKTRGSIYAETRWDEHGFSELDQKVSAASTRASSPGSMERQGGFTLIELLLCIAIVGLLASVAYPMYTEHLRETRVADGRALCTWGPAVEATRVLGHEIAAAPFPRLR